MAAISAQAEARAIPLAAEPVTLRSQAALPFVGSAVLAADNEALRLAAARAPGDPLPPAAPTPAATPTPEEPLCDRGVSPLYCVYTVSPGDTLSKIATRFGLKGTADVSSWELLVQSNKPDIITSDDYIQPGQKLRVPLKNGVVHVVLTGETLSELAAAYGVSPSAIGDAGNTVAATGLLTIGQELLISDPVRIPQPKTGPTTAPAGTQPPPAIDTPGPNATPASDDEDAPAAATPATAEATATTVSATPSATRRPGSATPTPGTFTTPARSSAGFIWPTTGPISSYFGPAHPLGIDIDLFANPNARIVAAAAGTVTFAGGNTCCSYGLYVIVDHGNGYTTLYAHLSSISVTQGQRVTQGQLLGLSGRTGYATGNHLHFEVRYNDTILDPLKALP